MGMVQPLIAFMIVTSVGIGLLPVPPLDLWSGPLGVVGFLLIARYITRHEVEEWLGAEPHDRGAFPSGHPWLMLLAWAGVCHGTSWVPLCGRLTGGVPGVSWVVAIMPWVVLQYLLCQVRYPLESVTGRPWTRREYTSFHVRVTLMVLVPVLLSRGLLDVFLGSSALERALFVHGDVLVPVGMSAVLALVFSLAPLLFRVILGAQPLGAGPLRSRLEAYNASCDFRPNDILVWRTGHGVTNALYVGIVPGLRYVVLTDALIDELSEDEVVAVYAHEAGHGKCRHTVSFLLMAFALMTASAALALLAERWLEPVILHMDPTSGDVLTKAVSWAIYIVVLGAFFLLGLGWISRRFETEADLHAARTIGGVEAMKSALERVGLHSGALTRGRSGSRHFGIGTRIGLMNRYRSEADFRAGFDRVLSRCRRGIVVVLALGLLGIAWHAPAKAAYGRAFLKLRDGALTEAKDPEAAIRLYREAADGQRRVQQDHGASRASREKEVAALAALSDVYMKVGDNAASRVALDEMASRVLEIDTIGSFNVAYLRMILDTLEGRGDERLARDLVRRFDAMTRQGNIGEENARQLYSDFFLVLRALGAERARPGDPAGYSGVGRLVLAARGERTDALLAAARRDVADRAYRRELLRRIDPTLAARL